MSNDVHNILDAISEAKAALDAKPNLERRIIELENSLAEAQRHNQGLEENIIGYKAEINDLSERKTKALIERDDALLRVMELEDRIHSVSRFLSTMQSEASELDKSLNPVPVPASEPTVEQTSELPVTPPTTVETPSTNVESLHTPVPPLSYDSGYTESAETKPRPYDGRLYYYCKDYMPLSTWLRDGGTEYSYYWRPTGVADHASQAPAGYSVERFSAA